MSRMFKNYLYLAVAVMVLLGIAIPQAQAAQVVFTLSGTVLSNTTLTYSSGGVGLTLTGYTCRDSLGNTVDYCNSVDTSTHNTKETLVEGSAGVGLANDGQGSVDEIPRSEFVQMSISTLPANSTITDVIFNMSHVVDGWDIYMSSVAGVFDSTSASPAAQGNNQSSYTLQQYNLINSTIIKYTTTGFSDIYGDGPGYYSITALQADCETLLTSVTVNYTTLGGNDSTTPEPATCLLMGVALLGLGAAARKLRARW